MNLGWLYRFSKTSTPVEREQVCAVIQGAVQRSGGTWEDTPLGPLVSLSHDWAGPKGRFS